MRPESYDDVLIAYEAAKRDKRTLQDRLTVAATTVARLQTAIIEKDALVLELRNEVEKYRTNPSGVAA